MSPITSNVGETYLLTAAQEQPVAELHDVRFVHARDLLAAVFSCIVKGEFRDPRRLLGRYDLQAFDDTFDGLVLQRRVLALGLLPNNDAVDVLTRTNQAS